MHACSPCPLVRLGKEALCWDQIPVTNLSFFQDQMLLDCSRTRALIGLLREQFHNQKHNALANTIISSFGRGAKSLLLSIVEIGDVIYSKESCFFVSGRRTPKEDDGKRVSVSHE